MTKLLDEITPIQIAQKAKLEFEQGVKLQQQGNLELSIQSYKRAIAIKADYVEPLIALAEYYKSQKKWTQVIKYYQRLTRIKPKKSSFYIKLARVLKKKNKIYSAIASYQKAFEINPNLSTKVHQEFEALHKKFSLNQLTNTEKEKSFDAYVSLGDNCEAGIQFVRIGYKESSFFRFTSSKFNTTFKIINNNFKDVFERKYIFPRPNCKSMVVNNKYGIAFHSQLSSKIDQKGNQEFSSTYDFEKVFQSETNKINYLIGKWNQMMQSERRILFILKNDSDQKYLTENMVSKLCELFHNNYENHNFQILCLQLEKFAEPQWKNPYLINGYFPYFAPRTSAMQGCDAAWNKIFADFPLRT